MYIDWITWGIWSMGFIILIVWIIVPVQEFRRLLQSRKNNQA
jgi:hypothetical protein